jgi:hypothetical protein
VIWLISGGRKFASPVFVHNNLDRVAEQRGYPTLVVVGGAPGVDRVAQNWAQLNNIPVAVHKADWDSYGRSAGPIRNSEMLEAHPDIDLGLFFPSGLSRKSSPGTYDMLDKVKAAGIEPVVFNAESHI